MGLDIWFDKEVYTTSDTKYFRKVNFLVGYFNLENCNSHVCTYDELTTLVEKCKLVLEARSEEVSKRELPCCEGFFFGEYEYNDSYYDDVKSVMDAVQELIASLETDDELNVKSRIVVNAWW